MRHSGKTFRKVLMALASASEGQHLIYISDTPAHLEHARIIAERCITNNAHARVTDNKIHFIDHNAGCLEFLTESQHCHRELEGSYRGMAQPHFVFDLN